VGGPILGPRFYNRLPLHVIWGSRAACLDVIGDVTSARF
jgi:hypothetical protein